MKTYCKLGLKLKSVRTIMDMKAFAFGVMLISSTSLYAGKIDFKKAARQFKKSKNVAVEVFEKNLLDKTYSCNQLFQDGSESVAYVRFSLSPDGIVDVMNLHKYELNQNGLIGSRDTVNGPATLTAKLKGNSLVIFHDAYVPSYVVCSPAKDERVSVEEFAGGNIYSLATNGSHSWIYVKTNSEGKFEIEFKSIEDRFVIDAKKIQDFLKPEKEYEIGPGSKVEYKNGYFFLKLELVDDTSATHNYVIKMDDTGNMLSSIYVGNFYGSVSVAPNGEISTAASVYTNGLRARVVRNYNADGKLVNEFNTKIGLTAQRLNSGLIFKGYCMHNMIGDDPCPEQRRNYHGVILSDLEGKMLKFISAFDHFEYGDGEPIWLSSAEDGGFYVGWRIRHNDFKNIVTIFKYSAEGEYENSWGKDAKNKMNRNINIDESFDKDMLTINGKKAYFARENVIFSFELK